MLCLNCPKTGVVATHALVSKEVTFCFCLRRLAEAPPKTSQEFVRVKDIADMGHTRLIIKSHNKPATKA